MESLQDSAGCPLDDIEEIDFPDQPVDLGQAHPGIVGNNGNHLAPEVIKEMFQLLLVLLHVDLQLVYFVFHGVKCWVRVLPSFCGFPLKFTKKPLVL